MSCAGAPPRAPACASSAAWRRPCWCPGTNVQASVVAQLDVERVDHRRDFFRPHYDVGVAERIAVAAISGDVAVLAPGIGDVEIIADERKAARDVQRVRVGRRVEQQRMLLARRAVVLEDADVFDAGLAFTSIADPPHDGLPLREGGPGPRPDERIPGARDAVRRHASTLENALYHDSHRGPMAPERRSWSLD